MATNITNTGTLIAPNSNLTLQTQAQNSSQLSQQIITSREEILSRILQEFSNIVQINGFELDTSQSSFAAYLLSVISTLTSDSLFYAQMLYNESTLVTAQLPQSINNWASYLGYIPYSAKPATATIQLTFPLAEGNFQFSISNTTQFLAGSIIFTSDYNINVNISNTGVFEITYIDDSGVIYPLPYLIQTINSTNNLIFDIPITQQWQTTETFSFPQLSQFQTYVKTLTVPDGQYITNINITTTDINNNTIQWTNGILVQSEPYQPVYQTSVNNNQYNITFGNNIFGLQPNGTANIIITYSNGISGNVVTGTIIQGDNLYTIPMNPNQPPQLIQYSCYNNSPATGGQNNETLSSIKINASSSLSMLNRIVSTDDYSNIYNILGVNNQTTNALWVLPMLKRSDLAINDIYLYTILQYNNEIVPSDTIYINLSEINNINEILPLQTFEYNGNTWINLFLLKLDYSNNLVNYYFLQPTLNITGNLSFSNNPTCILTNMLFTYNLYLNGQDSYNISITINTYQTNSNITYTQNLTVLSNANQTIYNPINSTTTNNVITYEYTIPRTELENLTNITINIIENNILTSTYFATPEIEDSLSSVTYSHIINYENNNYMLDIPVILSSYYNQLSNEDQLLFQLNLVSNFLAAVNSQQNKMMNVHLSAKLVRTYGQLQNLKYSTPNIYVQDILFSSNEAPTNPTIGQYYALSDPIKSTDPWFNYAGNIIVWNGTSWNFITYGDGTIIYNYADNQLYSNYGRIWIIPNYSTPISVNATIGVNGYSNNMLVAVQNSIINYLNNVGINGSVYLSDLISSIQNIVGINFVRITLPQIDLIYNNIYNNLTKNELYFFTPEFIYSLPNLINITTVQS